MLKRQAKQGAARIQHDIGKLYDLKNNIGEPQTIGIVGSQPNDSIQDTFLHEVLHAICHVMGLRETEKDENFVRRLATGLCTVWNHNPAAFKWWSGLVIITAIFGIYIAYNLLSGSGVNLVTAILLGLVMGAVLSFLIWNLPRWINNMASHNKNAEPNGVKPDDSTS